MLDDPRYQVRYTEGYYVVLDTKRDKVIPSPRGHYKKYRNGYLWDNSAQAMADALNAHA